MFREGALGKERNRKTQIFTAPSLKFFLAHDALKEYWDLPVRAGLKKMKILVTENHPEALDALVMTLEAYQHVTTRARGEREALEALANTPAADWPDVWVIGRGLDAATLEAAARSRFGTIPPCLALTAETQALGMDHLERAIARVARWH